MAPDAATSDGVLRVADEQAVRRCFPAYRLLRPHLDTGYARHDAHRSYLRNGFDMVCHHMAWTPPSPA